MQWDVDVCNEVYTFPVIINYSLSSLYIWCAVLKVLVTQLCISFGNGHDRVGDLATSDHGNLWQFVEGTIHSCISFMAVEICKTVCFGSPKKMFKKDVNLPICEIPQLLMLRPCQMIHFCPLIRSNVRRQRHHHQRNTSQALRCAFVKIYVTCPFHIQRSRMNFVNVCNSNETQVF